MEARSLAALNFLAANPPQYPIKPTEERQEPLVLYISRVPGTRDVILSPFKPQLKNVTAEDVANCLYYVHLDSNREQELDTWRNRGTDASRPRRSEDDVRSVQTIPRKPIAGRPMTPESPLKEPNYAPSRDVLHPQRSPGPLPLEDSGISLADTGTSSSQPRAHPPTRFPSRKPVRPQAKVDLPITHPPNSGPDMTRVSPPEYSTEVSEDQSFTVRAPTTNPHPSHASRPISMASPHSRSPSPKKQPGSFNLSLIRRDPSTGNQWNVGTIASHPSEDSDLYAAGTSSLNRPPIDVCIQTSGYAKFRGMPAQRAGDSVPNQLIDDARASIETHMGMFSRRIVMMYSKSFTSNLKEKFHKLEKNTTSRDRAHSRLRSLDTTFQDLVTPDEPTTQPGPGMKPRGYVFFSPWGGRCEFRTGNAGRSVRLHHLLHNNTGASAYNPLVAEQAEAQPTNNATSTVVSELRFNLPSSEIISSPTEQSGWDRVSEAPKIGNLAKFWRRNSDSSSHDDDDDDEISPFDINLGREKAGGGNRGKRAKMGKLIIGHDGLKMLDLVVAANVGVWWGAWEKNS